MTTYSRSKAIEELTSGYPVNVRQKYGIRQWNCQKRVKGHYPGPLDLDTYFDETLYWDSRTLVGAQNDPNHYYAVNDPVGCDILASGMGDAYVGDAQRASNKAYAKFVDQMKDSAQNANNFLEAGQSVGTILGHVRSLAKSIESVRHGDVVGAARALGVSLDPKKGNKIKQRAKQAADRWLELHFGWVPLVQDIGNSIDIIQGTGKSSPSCMIRLKTGAGFSGYSNNNNGTGINGFYYDTVSDNLSWSGGCAMRGLVGVENPNVAIANQLGFVNPLSVAWEAVPFSFVADWFSNVGQCLSAMSDFWGYQLHNGSTTTLSTTVRDYDFVRRGLADGFLFKQEGYSVKHFHLNRVAGIVSPVFKITMPKAISVTRGATAISLLVQQMNHIR